MELPRVYHSLFAAIIAYFILFFVSELFGLNKIQRFIIAVICGVLFYYYGERAVAAIQSTFRLFGL